MSILPVVGLFVAFGLAGTFSMLARWLSPRARLVLIPTLLGAYWMALLGLPFRGVITELPLVVLAGAAVGGPLFVFFSFAEKMKARQGTQASVDPFEVLGLGIALPVMAISLFSVVSRLNYHFWLGWECDGKILEVTRDRSNHLAPTLVVESTPEPVRFVQVDDQLWALAKAGQHLQKVTGSPWARLDGKLVRMVPRQVPWWNEPK